jgi:hypothetical protein
VINLFALQGEGESELVCVWVPLADAIAPRYVLASRGGVTCLAVHRSLLLAGADDGSVYFLHGLKKTTRVLLETTCR